MPEVSVSEGRVFRDDLPLAFVDIETTGGQAAWHRITEIAIVGAHGDALDFEWQTLLNPGVRIPSSIVALTGIDDELVQDAPVFADVAAELRERLQGRLFIAHNVKFDYHFIRGEFLRLGMRWQAPNACTARLSRRLFPAQRRHNLDTVIDVHGLICATRHRAMPDAAALWQFWRKLRAERSHDELDAALTAVSQTAVLPPQLPPELGEELPESAGVYRFYGAADALIYVGKANNLRQRVLSHFAAAHRDAKSKRLAEQTQRVEWTPTAGEIGALLLEARLVREQRPVYNRRLRGGRSFSWRWTDDALAPQLIERGNDDDAESPTADFGLYKSERDARKALKALAENHQLCLKMLGMEPGAGSCFAYQIKRCRGACVGAEAPIRHSLRARLAMARWKVADWPHHGAVAIIERCETRLIEAHVVDQWRHMGTVAVTAGDASLDAEELRARCAALLERSGDTAPFDTDIYRILAKFFQSRPRASQVLSLQSGTIPK